MHMPLATPEVDQLLLERYVDERDPAAFTKILGRHGDSVFQTCRRVLGDRALAQEATQETFLRLVRRPEAVTHSLGGWLHRTAQRIAIDAVRRDMTRRRYEADWLPGESVAEPEDREQSTLVRQSLAALPEEERSMLVRHYVDGVPQRRLARQMGVSPATLSRRMNLALAALRQEVCRRDASLKALLVLALAALSLITSAMHGRRWGTTTATPAPAAGGPSNAPAMLPVELAAGQSPTLAAPIRPRIAAFQDPRTSTGTLTLVFTDGRSTSLPQDQASAQLQEQTLRDVEELARRHRLMHALEEFSPAAFNGAGLKGWTSAAMFEISGSPRGPAAEG